jgi:hypothetical protein
MEVYPNSSNDFNEENDTDGTDISPSETDNDNLDESLSMGVIRMLMPMLAEKKPSTPSHKGEER